MADEKSNQDPAQAPEKIENPTQEISADDLDQVSGGMQASDPNEKVIYKFFHNLEGGDKFTNPVKISEEKKVIP